MTRPRPTAASAAATGDGENSEHHAGKQFGMRAEAPEGDQVEVGGVQHELNADEHENGVAAHERAGEADGEEQSRNEEITGESVVAPIIWPSLSRAWRR